VIAKSGFGARTCSWPCVDVLSRVPALFASLLSKG
jgi:hypothetical protein